jgi:hypothetical protein
LFGPEAFVAVEPADRFLHGLGIEPARHRAAGLAAGDQAGIGEHLEVFHDGRQRHRERPCQFADRHVRLLAQLRQQGTPGRIGERREGGAEAVGRLDLHHCYEPFG